MRPVGTRGNERRKLAQMADTPGLVDWDGFRVAVALGDVEELLEGVADALYSVRGRSGAADEVVVLLVRASTWVASAIRTANRADHDDLVRAAALLEAALLVDRATAGKRPTAIRDWATAARNLIVSVDTACHRAGPPSTVNAFRLPHDWLRHLQNGPTAGEVDSP